MKRIFSGIKATGELHLGNYIGAIRNWAKLADEYECLFSIVDLHSITIRLQPEEFRQRALDNFILYIAAGIDPDKNILFFQSHVPAHPMLGWVLNCYTYMGELSRMTQYKDALAKHKDNNNAGLFTYPVLMAADILAYNADLVPVGDDQKQHMELARDVAIRFNSIYGDTFTVPEVYIPKVGARIMDLQIPTKKMSKSTQDGDNLGCILLMDDEKTVLKKVKRAVTDGDNKIEYAEGKEGINNLLSIYAALTGATIQQAADKYSGSGYGTFKADVAEAVLETLRPVHSRFADLKKNMDYIEKVYKTGAEKAATIAQPTIEKVYDVVGFIKA